MRQNAGKHAPEVAIFVVSGNRRSKGLSIAFHRNLPLGSPRCSECRKFVIQPCKHATVSRVGWTVARPRRVFLFSDVNLRFGSVCDCPADLALTQGIELTDIARAAQNDWIFVDLVLPAVSGLEICRLLRARPDAADAHITMILNKGDEFARGNALRAGADDYMLGPITGDSLLERISLRRVTTERDKKLLTLGDLVLDLAAMQVRWRGAALRLMPKQFLLLRLFMENPGQVLSRRRIIEALGHHCEVTHERTVDVWVKRLRQVLRSVGPEEVLRTVSGRGYVLDYFEDRVAL